MKRTVGLLMLLALFLTSCQTQLKTARTAETQSVLRSVAVADLEVADERITYTLVPGDDIRRGGLENVKQAAEQEALAKHGNADVLLDPQYVITKKRTLFGSKVTSVTVFGRPAFYRNFRTLNDSVWANPAFNGSAARGKSSGLFGRTGTGGFSAPKRSGKGGNKGFECYLTLAAMYSTFTSSNDCCDGGDGFNFNLLSSFGYRFNPYFYLGAGIGIAAENDEETVLLPLYVNARVNFSKRPRSLFLDYKVGYTPADFSGNCTPEAFYAVALGYTFGKFDLAFQTTFQSLELKWCREYNGYYYDCGGADGEFVSFGLSCSYKF